MHPEISGTFENINNDLELFHKNTTLGFVFARYINSVKSRIHSHK
jgi:hypothetical protein